MIFPRATAEVLAGIAPAVAREITRWAPPVVVVAGEQNDDERDAPREPAAVPVLGNVVSAFLAKHVDPERKVWVRALESPAPPRLSLPELAEAAIPLLEPIVAHHRDRIIRAAPTPLCAELLTGLQRAMIFRIRGGRT